MQNENSWWTAWLTAIPAWVYLIFALLFLNGCKAQDEKQFDMMSKSIAQISDTAAMHGAEADVRLLSDGAGLIIDNRYMLSAGTLQANFKTNPLAPVLYKQMEYTHMVQMELVKANEKMYASYMSAINKLQPVPQEASSTNTGNGEPSKTDTE